MFTITKQFAFEAAHSLPHLPPDHPCARIHGHSYRVEVVIQSPTLDTRGFAGVDYRELDPFGDYLKHSIDHRKLNDIVDGPTTAENLARWFYELTQSFAIPNVVAVRVSETQKTWAEYRP